MQEFAVSDHEEEDQGEAIKDLEFRLTHDLNQLQVRVHFIICDSTRENQLQGFV